VKVGDLVYSVHMKRIGQTVLGLVGEVDRTGQHVDQGKESIFRIFWLDGSESSWYYSNEVERIINDHR